MKTILFLLLILSSYASYGQLSGQAGIDSLEAELPNAKADTNKVIILKNLSFQYYTINPDKGIEYGAEALALAKEIGWKKGEAAAYNSLGANNLVKSKYKAALEYWEKAYKINDDIGDRIGAGKNLGGIGVIYQHQSNYPKAIEYFTKALEINEEYGEKAGVAIFLGNIGNIYQNQSDYPKALEYLAKALKINEELGDKSGRAINLGSMGTTYQRQSDFPKALEYYGKALKLNEELGIKIGVGRQLGNIGGVYVLLSDYWKALEHYERALKIYKELDYKAGVANTLENMGNIYRNQMDYPEALELFGEALDIQKELGDKLGVETSLGGMGGLYLMLSQDRVSINPDELNEYTSLNKEVNLNNAITYTLKAIKIGEEIGELDFRSKFLLNLASAYKLKREPWKALEAIEEHHKLKDSVFNADKAKEIGKLEAEREQIEKENQLKEKARIADELASQRNRLQYLGIGAFVVFLAVLLLLSGRMKLSESIARALVFLSFIFLFEFILVMVDPWTDEYSEGIPLIKFAINMGLALIIFPMHQYFEKRVSAKVLGSDHPPKE